MSSAAAAPPAAAAGAALGNAALAEPTPSQTYLFDLQGFYLLRGVLSAADCARICDRLHELEAADYEDAYVFAAISYQPRRPVVMIMIATTWLRRAVPGG